MQKEPHAALRLFLSSISWKIKLKIGLIKKIIGIFNAIGHFFSLFVLVIANTKNGCGSYQGRTKGGQHVSCPSLSFPKGAGICPHLGVYLPPPSKKNYIKGQIMLFYISCDETDIFSKSTMSKCFSMIGEKTLTGGAKNFPGWQNLSYRFSR